MEFHFLSSQPETWTNEKHDQFLNSIESWFVLSTFDDYSHFHRRLDRYLPDTSDSTLDLKRRKEETHASSEQDLMGPKGGRIDGGDERRSKTRSSQPHNSSRDQVVPHIEKEKLMIG